MPRRSRSLSQQAQPPRTKAAEHATEGEENGAGDAKDSNAKEKIVWPGMTRAGTVVLPNGWSLKPAGRQVRLGDLPVQIAVHPTRTDPGDSPRRLRRARSRHREHDDGQDHRPGLAAGELQRLDLVARRQAALRRRRV